MTTLTWKKFLIAPAMIALFAGSCKVDPKILSAEASLTKGALLADTVKITVNKNAVLMTSSLKLGVTYMKNNLDAWGDGPSITRGTNLLKGAVVYHNQHIFGFGADNIEPRPGVFDWESLDLRVNMMAAMQSTPVITLATAPTWMVDPDWAPGKYEDSSDTDWSKVEWAPLPEHEKDFAHLCALVAKRYPAVKTFQVWNELKSMWDETNNRWDYVRYTRLYNLVYDSVKAARPDAIIGGPYIGIDSWHSAPGNAHSGITDPTYGELDKRCLDVVTYWLQNKHGGDFLCVDGGVDSKDGVATNVIASTKKFRDASNWLHSQTTLPIWWSEDYVGLNTDTTIQPAALGCMLIHHALAGDAASLRWAPEQQEGEGNVSNFFSSTLVPNGGKPFRNYSLYKNFNTYFPAGTNLCATTVSDEQRVMVMSSKTKILMINKTAAIQKTKINNTLAVNLNPYEAKYVTLP
ncbi:beta-galactosidase [Chitinophaga sp. ARDCPP14]|uniref:beta-galactosidase n=1 Tax=Chitinophaga sp. ARDCPP14 TaxID=3391139 RepID=UPI003F51C2B6